MFRINIISPPVHLYPHTPPPIHKKLPVTFRKWNQYLYNKERFKRIKLFPETLFDPKIII